MDTPDDVIGPINIGNPVEMSVEALALKVIEKTGSSVALEHLALPVDDPRQRQPDIGRARELLGWEPKVGLDEGLERTIAYFRDLMVPATNRGPARVAFEGARQ
jgi:UDP-glucuronate decarboxylase